MNERYDIWLTKLVPNVRHGSLFIGVLIFVVLLAAHAALGVFGSADPRVAPEVAVFFSVLIAYIIPVFRYITGLTAEAVRDLAPVLREGDDAAYYMGSIRTRTLRTQLSFAAIGLVAGFAHNWLLSGSLARSADFVSNSAPAAALFVGTLTVWLVVMSVVLFLVGNARLMLRIARRVNIDLLQPRAYTPFARVAVSSTLALIGAQAAFPIMWINPDVSAEAAIPGLIATAAAMLVLFALPLIGIHTPLAHAKRTTIETLDRAIKDATDSNDPTSQLAALNPLLTYRREIQSASEWPFDTSVAGRLALYLIIPPFTWIGAALIEMLLERMV